MKNLEDYEVEELIKLNIHELEMLRYGEAFYNKKENVDCTNMENSYGNIRSNRMKNSHFCEDCTNMGDSDVCTNSAQCKGCKVCDNCYKCIDCINLVNGLFCVKMKISSKKRDENSYWILNKPANEEQFEYLKEKVLAALKERNKKEPECNKKQGPISKAGENVRDARSDL